MVDVIQANDFYSEVAHDSLAFYRLFKEFDPQAVDIYVQCALYDAPGSEVRLKMPVVHECITYTDQRAMVESFELLHKLDEQVELRWVIPGRLSAL